MSWGSRAFESLLEAFARRAGAGLPGALRLLLRDQFGQPQKVVRRAAEDEQPVDLVQSAQLHLPERAGLLQPSKQQGDILPINIIVPMMSRFTIPFTRCARTGYR